MCIALRALICNEFHQFFEFLDSLDFHDFHYQFFDFLVYLPAPNHFFCCHLLHFRGVYALLEGPYAKLGGVRVIGAKMYASLGGVRLLKGFE